MIRSKNYYLKVLAVQEAHLAVKKEGIMYQYVYQNHIKDIFFISFQTYKRYLTVNAKKALTEISKLEQHESDRD